MVSKNSYAYHQLSWNLLHILVRFLFLPQGVTSHPNVQDPPSNNIGASGDVTNTKQTIDSAPHEAHNQGFVTDSGAEGDGDVIEANPDPKQRKNKKKK